MKKSTICKISLALAICCAIICGISIAPLVASAAFAIMAFICLICCAVVAIAGVFAWLFSAGEINIFSYVGIIAEFGFGLFTFVSPIARFSVHYLTPIAGGVALALGVLGIILSSISISRAKKLSQTENSDGNPESFALPEERQETQTANGGKKKAKKKKTEKGMSIASLVVSIVFSVVAVIAIIVAVIAVQMIS